MIFSTFSRRLAGLILILLLFSLIALVFLWYAGSLDIIDDEFHNRQNLTDQILMQSIIWIDRGISLYELQYIPSLEKAMELYQDAYLKSGGNITDLDLELLKQQAERELGDSWDFYLVDENGIVLKSTFKNDIGLDFKIWPSFYELVSQIRTNGTFVPDRMVKGYAQNAPYRKFAYMGTPDGRYLLEVSRNFQHLLPKASGASYKELIHNLPQLNPDIISLELYNSKYEVVSRFTSDNTPKNPTTNTLQQIIRTFSERKNSEETDIESGNIVRYTHLAINDTDSPSASEMFLVARTEYSTENRDQKKVALTIILGGFLLLTGFVASGVAIAGSRYLSKPINRIVEDIQYIADGDLDHKIRESGSSEFLVIEKAITQLVTSLKQTIASLKKREEELMDELSKRWRAEQNYRRLFESAHEAIFILKGTTIESCNNAATNLVGRNLKEVIGKEIYELSPPIQQDGSVSSTACTRIMNKVIQGEISKIEWDLERKDGTIIETEAQCSAVLSGDDIMVMALFRDVTELKEMRKREIKAIIQIEDNLVNLAAINDQIRNPLTAISILNEMQDGEFKIKIQEQVKAIDELINEVDKHFINTDKVRLFLIKHYGIHQKSEYKKEQKD